MEKEGKVKGEIIRMVLEYIKREKGEEGLKKIEGKLEELGYPLYFQEIKSFEEYRECQFVLILLLVRDIFGWTEEEIREMGVFAAKSSMIAKVLFKYFGSLTRFVEEIPNYWKKYSDFSSLKIINFNEEEKFVIFQLNDYNFHPLACAYHQGFFLAIACFSIRGENILLTETKCSHRGDKSHEYKITWE